jgi:hypothetical protein
MNSIYAYVEKGKNIVKENRSDWPSVFEGLKGKSIDQQVMDILAMLRSMSLNENNNSNRNLINSISTDMGNFIEDFKMKDLAVNSTFHILLELANKKDIYTEALVKRFQNQHFSGKVITCQEILHKIEEKRKIIDYDNIKKNVMLFPNIRRFFGEWLKREEVVDNHPFLVLLSDMITSPEPLELLIIEYNNEYDISKKRFIGNRIRRYKYLQAILTHIDGCLEKFGITEQGTKFIKRLKEEANFYQTLSQLEVAALLKRAHKVTLEQDIAGYPIDILCNINNDQIILEVTNIDMLLKLKLGNLVVDLDNKTKNTINKKLKEQICKYPENLHLPIVLVIDKTRSPENDIEDLKDALFGSLSVVVKYSNDDGTIVEKYLTRKHQDSIGHDNEISRRLSAVILYEQYFSEYDSTIRLKGYILKNPVASIKLDDNIIEELKHMLFEEPVLY